MTPPRKLFNRYWIIMGHRLMSLSSFGWNNRTNQPLLVSLKSTIILGRQTSCLNFWFKVFGKKEKAY